MSADAAQRDERLGAALRALGAPRHRPGFFADLERRLAAERAGDVAVPRRRVRRPALAWTVRLAVAAACLAAAVSLLEVAGPRSVRPQLATAARVQADVRASLAGLRTLSGVLVAEGPREGGVRRWRFALTASGDVRLEGPGAGEVIAYDAAFGVVRSAQRSASLGGGPLFYAERSGVAPGPPDAGPPSLPLLQELGAYTRALLAARDPRVRAATYEGRPAWRLDVDVAPNAIVPDLSADRLEITVDRATALPVRVVERRRGALLGELRLERLAVDRPLPADAFRPAFPAGAEVLRSDDGFRRVSLGEVAHAVGYAPLVPGWVPDGYELAEVAVADVARPTGTEAGNPPSRMVVSLSYRRGLDQLLVTTRLAASGESWSDPLATGEGFVDRPEQVVLGHGALRGVEAELVVAPRGIPHLWARGDDLVVTVGGDVDRDELMGGADSLERR